MILTQKCNMYRPITVSYTHLDVYKRQYKEIPFSKFIRIQRFCWAGHVMRMEGGRNPKRALLGTWEGTRPRGRPRKRWEDGLSLIHI